MDKIEKVVYTGRASSTGGREGTSKSDDGRLTLTLSTPKELGGNNGPGTNPEQLFAAGYSACFIGAIKHVAMTQKIKLPDDMSVSAEVGIGGIPQGFGVKVKLVANIPGMDHQAAKALVDKAHEVCPYSNATRGNIEVDISLA